jgi:formylglycine-generating enzyme required for sulfatase activity
VAARYPDGRFYPWGKRGDPAKTNTGEGNSIGQTSAVGIYPHGANPALGLYDLSGNIWEWCRNKYEEPDDVAVDGSGAPRVVRGGSWVNGLNLARAAYRSSGHPDDRDHSVGCRVVRRPPSQAL